MVALYPTHLIFMVCFFCSFLCHSVPWDHPPSPHSLCVTYVNVEHLTSSFLSHLFVMIVSPWARSHSRSACFVCFIWKASDQSINCWRNALEGTSSSFYHFKGNGKTVSLSKFVLSLKTKIPDKTPVNVMPVLKRKKKQIQPYLNL